MTRVKRSVSPLNYCSIVKKKEAVVMDSQRITTLLDKSCADALNEWWAARNRAPSYDRASVAIEDLKGKLNKFEKPNYDDDYILSAYVIVYQINHINMALRAFSSLKRKRAIVSSSWNSLRIVDLGAGTSAGRIGAALMAADAMKGDHKIERIYFDELDISAPMLKMGEFVWEAFVKRVHKECNDTDLARAVEVLDYNQHVDWREVGGKRDCETWLTAFHVIYQDQNRYSLKEMIRRLYERVDPMAGAFSCFHSTAWVNGARNLSLLQTVFPPFEVPSQCSIPSSGEKCPTSYISNWAQENDFITYDEFCRGWRPFLHVRSCILKYGYNIPF